MPSGREWRGGARPRESRRHVDGRDGRLRALLRRGDALSVREELHVTETGDGDTLVVLVHGVLDRARSFRHVIELLAPDHRVVSYDRRGYGAAIDAPGTPADIHRHVADLLEILDGRRAVLVGHSFGGVPVLGAAATAPQQIDAVAVYETVIAWAPEWDDEVMIEMLGRDDTEDAGLQLMFGRRYDELDDERRATRRREATTFITEERSVRTGTPPFDLTAIAAPVVYGRSPMPALGPVVDHLERSVGHVDVVELADAGHTAHVSHPEAFADLVRRAVALAGRPAGR